MSGSTWSDAIWTVVGIAIGSAIAVGLGSDVHDAWLIFIGGAAMRLMMQVRLFK